MRERWIEREREVSVVFTLYYVSISIIIIIVREKGETANERENSLAKTQYVY